MLNLILTLMFLCYLIGCAPKEKESYIDPEFVSWVELFDNTYGVKYKGGVVFENLTESNNGICVNVTFDGIKAINHKENYIKIDRTYWITSDEYSRHQLIFHELGHCALGLGHDTAQIVVKNKVLPKSIMFPFSFGKHGYYRDNINYYIQEIMTKK